MHHLDHLDHLDHEDHLDSGMTFSTFDPAPHTIIRPDLDAIVQVGTNLSMV